MTRREQIARIISPHAWRDMEGPWEADSRWLSEEHRQRILTTSQGYALAKADQIMGVEGGEELQDQLIAAYMAGCQAVHDNYQPDPDPDFTEAAWDYALSVLKGPTHD